MEYCADAGADAAGADIAADSLRVPDLNPERRLTDCSVLRPLCSVPASSLPPCRLLQQWNAVSLEKAVIRGGPVPM